MNQARHRVTHDMRGLEHELLDTFWKTITPYILQLRDLIMQNTSLLRYPRGFEPASPSTCVPVKIPSLATRRAACTHLTMIRLHGDHRCNVCNQPSQLGWVYSCTQDEIPLESTRNVGRGVAQRPDQCIDFSSSDPSDDGKEHENNFLVPTCELSVSVEQAIKDGHYTPQQVDILRAQKQNVVNVAKIAIEKFEESERATNSHAQTKPKSKSSNANPHLTFPQIPDVTAADPAHEEKLPDPPKLEMFPYCEFRACQCCRPTYRDRTWLRFEDVFAMELPLPARAFEDNNRPVAKFSLMKRIGFRLRRRRPQLHYSYVEQGRSLRPQLYRTSPNPFDSSDIADESVEPESKGFRDSMKRAFRGMMASRQNQPRHIGRRRKAKESSTSDEDAAEFDMGLWNRMNDDLLKEASGIPLPLPTNDSIDGLSLNGEKTDIAGVAVTEEAADLKSADIIVSV